MPEKLMETVAKRVNSAAASKDGYVNDLVLKKKSS